MLEGSFGEFLSQIPLPIILLACGLPLLIISSSAYLLNRMSAGSKSKKEDLLAQPEEADDSAAPTEVPEAADIEQAAREPSEPLQEEVTPVKVRSQGASQVELNTGSVIEAEEVVAVLRDARDGKLIVQIDNVGYRTLADMPEVKQRFMQIMKELAVVVKADDSPSKTAQPAETKDTPAQPETPQAQPDSQTQEQEEESKPAAPTAESQSQSQRPGNLPSFKLEDNSVTIKRGLLGPKIESPAIPELDIAGAIEAYLQHKLKQTGRFQGREIHVRPGPGGGVRIQVDANFYEAVSDVADRDVREFLSTTIQEWQEHH